MSIIGPRPLLVSYLPWYTEEEKQRHDVRPGLSGLAQVNGRNSVTWEEKFSWDLKYVDRITFLGDVKISVCTNMGTNAVEYVKYKFDSKKLCEKILERKKTLLKISKEVLHE